VNGKWASNSAFGHSPFTIHHLPTEYLCQIQNEDIQKLDAASDVRMTR